MNTMVLEKESRLRSAETLRSNELLNIIG